MHEATLKSLAVQSADVMTCAEFRAALCQLPELGLGLIPGSWARVSLARRSAPGD